MIVQQYAIWEGTIRARGIEIKQKLEAAFAKRLMKTEAITERALAQNKDRCNMECADVRRNIAKLKEELAVRPHIPNKPEGKELRRKRAKERHGQGKSRSR